MIINSRKDLVEAIAKLCEIEPQFGQLAAQLDLYDETALPLRRWPADFAALARIIIGQQVSTASAAAIYGRLEAEGEITPESFLAGGGEMWKRVGLSRPKQASLSAIATTILSGGIDLESLSALPADAARTQLIALKGIGPWTAELFLLACVGNGDAFPAGDIAVQEAARDLFALENRPSASELEEMSLAWSPLRAAAARLLWAHYRQMKRGSDGAIR